jgi:hypothetical protein
MLNECTYMHKYIVHVWLFLKIVQFNSLIMSYVHQLGIWSSDYWLTGYSRRRKLNVVHINVLHEDMTYIQYYMAKWSYIIKNIKTYQQFSLRTMITFYKLLHYLRRTYLPRYYVIYPSIVKMNGLLSFCNVEVYKRLSLFLKKIAGMF